jgi:hypothetical protein
MSWGFSLVTFKRRFSVLTEKTLLLYAACGLLACSVATASPDEGLLGQSQSYPLAPRLGLIHDPAYIVGSFSGMDRIAPSCELAPADQVAPLRSRRVKLTSGIASAAMTSPLRTT